MAVQANGVWVMSIPRVLRKQAQVYATHGFTMTGATPRNGSHFLCSFAEFSQPQILTKNADDPRALKNNIARFRALAKQEQQT